MHSICIFLLFVIPCDEQTSFNTGKALLAALESNVSWSSVGTEIGDQLRELQTQSNVVILRDRRVDPHRPISVKTDFVPRVQVLKQISDRIPDGTFCVTDNFACVGPAETIHRLPLLLSHNGDQVNTLKKKIDAAAFRRLIVKSDASWEHLSEPRQILVAHSKTAGFVIANPDAIPHDVWAGERLPPMSFGELATVILNQFDLTFKLAGDRAELTIIPVDPDEVLEHRYAVGSKLKAKVTTAWQQTAPKLDIRWTGANATVTTTLRQHSLLNAALQHALNSVSISDSIPTTPAESIRSRHFTLKAERATIGQLIDFFRKEKILIEVIDQDSPETVAIFNESVSLRTLSERQPGLKLFPLIFGKHFKTVDVRDDRVVLSRE